MRGRRSRWALLALTAVMTVGPSVALAGPAAADAPDGFTTVSVLDHLDDGPGGGPTAFAYAPDGRIFVARKTGVVNVYDSAGGAQHTFLDIRDEVNSVQSRGLVGLTLDPNFATNGRVYILFTQELRPDDPDQGYPAGGQLISIKGKASDPDTADPSTRVTLVTGFNSVSRLHSVAGLAFDNEGHILVGFADGSDNNVNQGQSLQAEDLSKLNGKILRIDPTTGNGIPGNPYYDAAHPSSVQSRIYARGLRNPFRFSVDPQNDNLYVGEVGWNTWEQLDVFTPTFGNPDHDRNGGWPCYEGGDGVSLVQPDYQTSPYTASTCHAIYKPSEGGTGVGSLVPIYGYRHDEVPQDVGSAIVGGPKYTGTSNYPAQYVGKLFIGDYARDGMKTVDPTTGAANDFGTLGTWGNPVDIHIAPDGNVAYLGIASAELREIVYTGSNDHPPVAVAHATPTSGPAAPLTVKFSSRGSSDPDPGDTLTFNWDFGDGKSSTKPNPSHIFKTTGAFNVTLTVSDGHVGGVDTATLDISVADDPPTISFESPDPSLRYAIGDTINVSLAANDNEDGPLSGDSVQTTIIQHTGGHTFPGGQFSGLTGSFQAADLGFEDSYYELQSSATDSTGQTTTADMNVLPATVPVTIASAPSGLSVSVDAVSRSTPYTWNSIVGSVHEVLAPTTTTMGGGEKTFGTWSTPTGIVADPFASFTTPAAATTIAARYDSTADGFAVSDASVVEGNTGTRAVALTVSRSTPSASASSVDWATVKGTAKAGTDFKAASGTVNFAAGETSHTISVLVKGDTAVEPDEQFTVQLSNPVGGDPIVQPTGTVTILDDDPAGAGLRAAVGDVEVLEGGSGNRSAAFTVTLSAPSPGGVSVNYATVNGTADAPDDYASASGTINFAAGQTASTVEVQVSGDREPEPTEQFTLSLSNPVGATIARAVGTALIATDDSLPLVSISSGSFFEGDSGKPKVPFTVSLSVPSDNPVTVDWAASHISTNDADVKLDSGTVTIPAGAMEAEVDVTTVADTVVEQDEAFGVTLSNAVGATIEDGSGIEIIRNDDPGSPANRISVGNVAIVEGDSGARDAQFLVTMANPSASPVTVHFVTGNDTAIAGTDFTTKSVTVTFPAGSVSRVVAVPILGDGIHEGDETFTVTLANPSGGTLGQAVGTGTIVDDD